MFRCDIAEANVEDIFDNILIILLQTGFCPRDCSSQNSAPALQMRFPETNVK